MCILGLARGFASSKWERWSCGTAGLQHHHPWRCLLRNRHWARFVTAGSSSQLLPCLALISALSAQTSLLSGEETMQTKAWLSHWTGYERPESWLISDLVGLKPALAKKKKSNFFSFSYSAHIKQDQCLLRFCNFLFAPFAMQAHKHSDSISSHKCYGSSIMSFSAFSIFWVSDNE